MDVLTPKQEATLAEMQKKGVFRLAVQNAYNHIIITDIDGVILYANQATQRITGYGQQELIGNTPSVWGGRMPQEFYAKLWKTIKEDRYPFINECTNRRKSGETYRARITVSPMIEEDGTLLGFVGIEEQIWAF
ncbi:MAG: PAS domain S-box protein [Candidatus Peribacteraceae bacterium]|nr:PAS domain S-box protein [Candidatus Peribacteraceae bacterium]MDD5742561.1 PAS domain S-box protein [Candidatus Peribacteraceae bacterium]